jgi:hypothetical protein
MDAGIRALRDAEIYTKRQAGRTLRALAAEFGVSVEAIRGAEFREERRKQAPKDSIRLSPRARNSILNACWSPDLTANEHAQRHAWSENEGPEVVQLDKALAQQVAELGRAAFLELPNCGKKTLAEVDAWLKAHGLRWSAQIDLSAADD